MPSAPKHSGCDDPAGGGPVAGARANPRTSRRTSAVTAPGPAPAPGDPLLAFAPVPHVAPRRNSITASRQRAFIAALAASGVVAQAARSIGASLEALYKLRHRPGAEGFAARLAVASASPRPGWAPVCCSAESVDAASRIGVSDAGT